MTESDRARHEGRLYRFGRRGMPEAYDDLEHWEWSTRGAAYDDSRPSSRDHGQRFGGRDGRAGSAGQGSEPSEALDYSALLRKLWRRKFLIAAVTILGTGLATAATMWMQPHYVAHALVVIGDPAPDSRVPYGPNKSAAIASPPDTGTIQTEVEILKSPQLALEVIRDLKLEDNPEFNPFASQAGRQGAMTRIKEWLSGADAKATAPADPAAELSLTAENFLRHLQVGVKGTSRMIDVAFDCSDPHLAMRVANAVLDHYVNNQVELRFQSAQRTSSWLQDKIAHLQTKVQAAEHAVEAFRARAGLFSTPGGSPLLLKQMTDVSADLANAQTARAALEARLSQIRASMKSRAHGKAMSDIVDSPFMRTLDTQEADAEQKLAEALSTLGDRNPTALGLRERLQHIHVAMKNEGLRVVASLEADLKIAQMKEDDLRNRLSQLQGDVAQMNNSEITLRKLEREAQADRLVLNNFIARFKEASQETDISAQRADAQIVSYAQLPAKPDRPKKGLLIVIAGMVSLVGGAFLVNLIENADRSLHGLEEVEAHLKIAALGMVPISKAARLSPSEAARYGSSYREAVKTTYSRLFWAQEAPQVVLTTSAFAAEGKTTLALSLAAMAAQGGKRVVLLDADFWKKGASAAVGAPSGIGLAELLEGKATLADAIVTDPSSGADIISPGQFSRASLLAWMGKVPSVIDSLRKRYDIVVIDAPPVLSVPEASLLAAHADATIVAVRWGSTPRDAATATLKRLRDSGALLAGFVMTMVSEHRSSSYGYLDAGYSSKGHAAYRSPTGAIGWPDQKRMSGKRIRRASIGQNGPARHALLVLNIQEDFTSPNAASTLPQADCDRLIETINNVSGLASNFGMTVLYAYQELDNLGPNVLSRLLAKIPGSGQLLKTRPDRRLEEVSEHTFLTSAGDAFSNKKFDEFLREKDISHLFLMGMEGTTSVNQTAHSALDRGYRVTFIRDGIFTAFEDKWQRLLESFETAAAFAITSGEFVEFAAVLQRANEAKLKYAGQSADPPPA